MFIYLCASILALELACFADIASRRGPKKELTIVLLVVSASILFAVQAFREGVGADYNDVYVNEFYRFAETGESRFELGYTLLMSFALSFKLDYHFVLGVCAAIIVFGVYLAIYRAKIRYSVGVLLFILSGLFFFSMNGVRQSVAIALLLNAAVSWENGQRKSFLIYTLIATMFHMYALLILLAPVVMRLRLRVGHLLLAFVSMLVLSPLITSTLIGIGAHVSNQIYLYANNDYLREIYLSGDFDISDFLLCAGSICFLLIMNKADDGAGRWKVATPAQAMLSIGVLLTALTGSVAIVSRAAAYCSPFLILAIGQVETEIELSRKRQIITAVYFASLFALFIYLYLIEGFSQVLPYVSVFN